MRSAEELLKSPKESKTGDLLPNFAQIKGLHQQNISIASLDPTEFDNLASIIASQDSKPIFEGIETPPASMKAFIKTYFKKDLQLFKDEDLKKRMALVRKAVAILEREHFNSQ